MIEVGSRITVRTWVEICNISLPGRRAHMSSSNGLEHVRPAAGKSGTVNRIDNDGVLLIKIGTDASIWIPPEWCHLEGVNQPVSVSPDREFNGHCNPAEHPGFKGWCGRLRFHSLDCPSRRPS